MYATAAANVFRDRYFRALMLHNGRNDVGWTLRRIEVSNVDWYSLRFRRTAADCGRL